MEEGRDFTEFTSPWPFRPDPAIQAWRDRLNVVSSMAPSIREAIPHGEDARRVWGLQLACEPIRPKPIDENVSMIETHTVLLAEAGGVHVGYCVAVADASRRDLLFLKVVAVVPELQHRGVGLALLAAAAEREPQRDIALATHQDNLGVLAMGSRFAESVGGVFRRVKLGTFRDRDLGFSRGEGYRVWLIERPRPAI